MSRKATMLRRRRETSAESGKGIALTAGAVRVAGFHPMLVSVLMPPLLIHNVNRIVVLDTKYH